MPTAKTSTINAYLKGLPPERRDAFEALRETINAHLPKGYEHGMQYNMPAWYVPHSVFPDGYHCDPKQPLPFCSIANTKGHIAWYAFCLYTDESAMQAFVDDWQKTCPDWKLDMGKACVRFKKTDRIPYKVIGRAVKRATLRKYLTLYKASRPTS